MGGYIPIVFLQERATQPSIRGTWSRQVCGMTWGIITVIFLTHYLVLWGYMGLWRNIIGVTWEVVIVWTLAQTMATDPMCLHADSENKLRLADNLVSQATQSLLVESLSKDLPAAPEKHQLVRLCSTCLVDKSLCSLHCGSCNRCQVTVDHHCPYVNNCIGLGNRRVFVCFLVSASSGCLYFGIQAFLMQLLQSRSTFLTALPDAATCYKYTSNNLDINNWFLFEWCLSQSYPTFFAASFLGVGAAIWIGVLMVQQLCAIARETTSFEQLKRNNFGKDLGSFQALWRGMANIGLFFQTGKYFIFSQVSENPCRSKACNHHHQKVRDVHTADDKDPLLYSDADTGDEGSEKNHSL